MRVKNSRGRPERRMMTICAVVDEGIGTVFVGADRDLLRELPGIPDDYIPVGIALLGHEPPDAFETVAHSEHW